VRFGGATARSADDYAARFGPYSREHISGDGGSVSTRPRKGEPYWKARWHSVAALLLMYGMPWHPNYHCSALVKVLGCVQSLYRRWICRCGPAACLPSCRVRLSQNGLFLHPAAASTVPLLSTECPCAQHQCGMSQGAAERRRTSQSRQAIARLWCWRQMPTWTRADLSTLQSRERLPERRRQHRGAAPSNGSQPARQVCVHCCVSPPCIVLFKFAGSCSALCARHFPLNGRAQREEHLHSSPVVMELCCAA